MVAIPVEDESELVDPLIVSEEAQPAPASEDLTADTPLPDQAAALPLGLTEVSGELS